MLTRRWVKRANCSTRRVRSIPRGASPIGPTRPSSCIARLRMPLLASGSRRAATSGCEGREGAGQTVKEHDRRSIYAGPLTRHFSSAVTVLNSPQFHAGSVGADLARRKPGVQIPSPPPPTLQVRASSASSWRRSLQVAAALRPRAHVAVQPGRLAATRRLDPRPPMMTTERSRHLAAHPGSSTNGRSSRASGPFWSVTQPT
jgi:hypothetical protein